MATSIGVTVFLESLLIKGCMMCVCYQKLLVTKKMSIESHSSKVRHSCKGKMGTELPEILVRINLKFNFSGQQTCGFGKPQAAKAIWKIIFC